MSGTTTPPPCWKRLVLLWMTGSLAVGAYWNPTALRGPFVYDDVASIVNNPVVHQAGAVPWTEALVRDFWGGPMRGPKSHKSYRPLTTLTFRFNRMLTMKEDGGTMDTYYFHAINVLLHGINTGLIAETAFLVFGSEEDLVAPLITGVLFGIHPVHAEAVSNITSRGELLMTCFFLLAFLSYAHHIPSARPPIADVAIDDGDKKQTMPPNNHQSAKHGETAEEPVQEVTGPADVVVRPGTSLRSTFFVYCLPCFMAASSMFSKEQGATTLCSLVAYDFITNHSSVQEFLSKLRRQQRESDNSGSSNTYTHDFLKRSGILAMQTLFLVCLRIWLNGEESSPNFVYEQNPPGLAKEHFARIFTVNWIYCLYLRDMIFPVYLTPDWSGHGIPLIQSMSLSDGRAWLVVLLWIVVALLLYSLFFGGGGGGGGGISSPPPDAARRRSKQQQQQRQCKKDIRRIILTSFFAFLFLPFLLSSNLLITTGFTKADRVIYLPLFGYCLIEACIIRTLCDSTTTTTRLSLRLRWFAVACVVAIQCVLLGIKLDERNLAWADEYTLWTKAYEVNPRSFHTRSQAGRMLAKHGEYHRAETVLRPIRNVRTNGGQPNDTFLYTVALANLHRCTESHPLIDDAIRYIHEQRRREEEEKSDNTKRYNHKMSIHSESSLLVSRAFCTSNIMEKGRILYEATQLDPSNSFAQTQFQNYLKTLQELQQQQANMQQRQMQ